MKLIVKLPANKPPFIGILFPRLLEAEKTNQELVLDHKNANYRIVFEFIGNWVNIKLISEDIPAVKFYNKVTYDRDKLSAWIYLTRKSKGFNFSHLILVNDKETVVKTLSKTKLFVLKIEAYEILSKTSEDFDLSDENIITGYIKSSRGHY